MRQQVVATDHWTGKDVFIGNYDMGVVIEQRDPHGPIKLYDMSTRKAILSLHGQVWSYGVEDSSEAFSRLFIQPIEDEVSVLP